MSTQIRQRRIASEIQRVLMQELAKISMDNKELFSVNISYVKMSKDLNHAKIYVSGNSTSVDALNEEKGRYKTVVAKSMHMKYVPNIVFIKDSLTEEAYKVDKLLKKIKQEDAIVGYNTIEKKIAEILKQGEKILIVSHINPDGDNIGSTLGLVNSLRQIGKKTIVANKTGIPDNFMFLCGADKVISTDNLKPEFDIIVFADCGSIERADLKDNVLDSAVTTINIDHHKTSTNYADYNLIDPDAPSTSFVIYKMLKHHNFPIDKDIAEALYAALLTDTGSFRYSSTSSAAFEMASDLISCEVDPWYVASSIYENKKPSQLKLLGKLLSKIEYYFDNRFALITITQDDFDTTETTTADSEGIANYARAISGVEIGALIRIEKNDMYKVSLRSKSLDVTPVATAFNGGGHKNASGFSLAGPLNKAKINLLSEIKKLLS